MVVVPRIVPLMVTLPAAVLMVQSPPWALGFDSLIPPGGQIIVLVIRLSVIRKISALVAADTPC